MKFLWKIIENWQITYHFLLKDGRFLRNGFQVLVVLLFISCNVAALLLNIFEARLADILGHRINYVVDASNLLVVFNSSFNFVIYVTFSNAFRTTLQRYFRRPKSINCGKNTAVSWNSSIFATNRNCSNSTLGTCSKSTICHSLVVPHPERLI